MHLISKLNKGFQFLLYITDIYSKHSWVAPLKDKNGITITYAFQKVLNESNHKPKKIWVNKDSEFYNKSTKPWLQDNEREMYSTHNEGKTAVAEELIRTLKKKTYEYMASVSKNVYINNLADIVDKYSNTYHSTIKMKPADVKSSTYFDFGIKNNEEDPKFVVTM